jgi:hypothetical protein
MADQKTRMTRRQIEEKIVALAWKDDGFRKRFLADPKREFETHLGTALPATLKISAYAEDDNHLHFVIPAKPGSTSELSDADLEKVAGGIDVIVSGAVLAIAAISGVAGSAVATLVGKNEGWRG